MNIHKAGAKVQINSLMTKELVVFLSFHGKKALERKNNAISLVMCEKVSIFARNKCNRFILHILIVIKNKL